jgi:hypothetical protein
MGKQASKQVGYKKDKHQVKIEMSTANSANGLNLIMQELSL